PVTRLPESQLFELRTGRGGPTPLLVDPAPRPARAVLVPSPRASLAVLKNPNTGEVETQTLRLGDEPLRWLFQGLLGEIERAPVDRDESLPANVGECPQRLFGRRVACAHDDRGHIGPNGQRGEIERPQARADLLESAEVRAVTSEVETLGAARDDPAAPEAAVAIPERPSREVLSRDG